MYDSELDRFKSNIPLLQFAIERYGYLRDRKKSTHTTHVLRHPTTNDKLIVRRDSDGHWTYFSVRDDLDNGTIVDFVKIRAHCASLREVRQELRAWNGTSPSPEERQWERSSPAPSRDPAAIAAEFQAAKLSETSHYLESRGLRRETLSASRFAGTWRLGRRGNVLFAHKDEHGALTGFEIKNRGFTSFSPGGTKAAWQSNTRVDDRIVVVAESAIDALSFCQLHPESAETTRYLSTGGTPGGGQLALLDRLFEALPQRSTVVAAVDRDPAGEKLASQLQWISICHAGLSFARHSPERHKDWNDVLQHSIGRARDGLDIGR